MIGHSSDAEAGLISKLKLTVVRPAEFSVHPDLQNPAPYEFLKLISLIAAVRRRQ